MALVPSTSVGGSGSSSGATQLDYAETTATLTVTQTTEGTAEVYVTGAAVAYDGSTRVCIEWYAPYWEISTGAGVTLVLYDGAASIGKIAVASSTGTTDTPLEGRRFLTPSSASHTYSIRAFKSGGTATVVAGAGGVGNFVPGFIRITVA